jgi:hypothetical protein
MALIYYKNGIERFWRKSQANSICQEEKQKIRAALVWLLFNEQSEKLSKLVCLSLAKIARIDFPTEWYESTD